MSDSVKASSGEPEAAYCIGEVVESDRLGGPKNLEEFSRFTSSRLRKVISKQPIGWPNFRPNWLRAVIVLTHGIVF